MLPDSAPSSTHKLPKAFGTGIIVTQMTSHNPLSPPQALVEMCKQQLEVQLQHSEMVGGTSESGVPLWRLKCGREGELQSLCGKMRQLCSSVAEQVSEFLVLSGCMDHDDFCAALQ